MSTPHFAGWRVVTAAFAVLFLAYGLQFSYGLFVTPMAAELGLTRAQTALPYSVYVFGYMLLSLVTGPATDRHGPRVVIAIGAVLLGLGWGLCAVVSAGWQMYVTLGAVAALGMSVSWVPCNATVARWFVRRRGTAVGLASAGTSVGNFCVPPLAALLIVHFGWRAALLTLSACCAGGMIVAAHFMRRDPESVGQQPDGDPTPPVAVAVGGLTLKEALRTEAFLLLTAIYVLTWLAVFVPFVHGVAMAEDLGFSKLAGASVLSAIGIGGVFGRLGAGLLLDQAGAETSLVAIFGLQIASFLAFVAATSLPLLWLAAALFGLAYGGGVTVVAPICTQIFGRAHVAAIVGTLFAFTALPCALGPWLAGWLFDLTGGYRVMLWLAAAANVLALLLSLLLGRAVRALPASSTPMPVPGP
ncbi:MAG: MFS transporter [Gammaproteobacteria bacterium]